MIYYSFIKTDDEYTISEIKKIGYYWYDYGVYYSNTYIDRENFEKLTKGLDIKGIYIDRYCCTDFHQDLDLDVNDYLSNLILKQLGWLKIDGKFYPPNLCLTERFTADEPIKFSEFDNYYVLKDLSKNYQLKSFKRHY